MTNQQFFDLVTSNLYKFVLFSQTFSIKKLNIQTLHCYLDYLYINSIIKFIPILSSLKMPKNKNKFFCKTFLFVKQVKYFSKI